MEWILKLVAKFKNKSAIIINDSLDVTDIKSSTSGRILVVKSTNIDHFLMAKLPSKFFLIDIFPDDQCGAMLDLNLEIFNLDSNLEKRAKLRQVLSSGMIDISLSEKILNKLCKRK